ncbi:MULTISPECIES: DUF4225 domain-containing protein [Pseudomonas]|uniref:DUF4225 domain-containing protein n=1 Tax=Pseudomonas sp. MIL9 TaxID=2807620 RepID=UPI0010292BFF|nr:DUF4225 domain-containing protein [Pseudomonas sp. MIL9]MBM6445943.1 DUF4225 domain-containing protein [Pseudomonas sp. MIL9]RZO11532.1 DUF4225 domain-containing protein [Pseudomonas moorei]
MNESSCDIHDVTRSASDLVAAGCAIGMAHIPDGFARLRFGSMVASYVDEVIQAVDEGVISAWQAVQEIRAEYEDLASKARFYLQNGVGVVAGVMQVRTGFTIIGTPGGLGVIPGTLMVGHGANNIYESFGNIYRGPGAPSTVGPVRYFYRDMFDEKGDMIYYSMDLFLSAIGVFRPVSKPGSVELFRRDPINYEMAYRQSGRLALFFEVLVDFFTIDSMLSD